MRGFITLILLLLGTSYAVGQALPPGTIGRSRDGRAFRVDESGFRLTDQLAELEVTVEELKKQNFALENEIELKQRMLNECGVKPTPLVEKDLVQQKDGSTPSCDHFTQPLQQRIAELERRQAEKEDPAALCSQFTQPLQQKIAALESAATSDCASVGEAKNNIQRHEQALAGRDARISELEKELASLSAERRQAAGRDAERAKPEPKSEAATKHEQVQKPQRSAEVQSALAAIQKLIARRKDLFDAQRGRGKGVTIRLQPLITSSNEPLDSLRSAASRVSGEKETEELLSKLHEISAILQNDIKTLERIAR